MTVLLRQYVLSVIIDQDVRVIGAKKKYVLRIILMNVLCLKKLLKRIKMKRLYIYRMDKCDGFYISKAEVFEENFCIDGSRD